MKNKKRKTWKMLILLASLPAISQAQGTYTLDSLQAMARNRYPQSRQLVLASLRERESESNINSNWLPKAGIVGTATYQSEVTKITLPASLPLSIESPAKDQYKAGVEVSQLLFDGGVNATQKNIEKLNLKAETNRIEGELLSLKSKVNQLFFALMINNESFNALNYVKKDLTQRHHNIEAAVQAGTMLSATMRELEAEMIGADQKIIENRSQRLSLLSTLSILTQEKLDTTTRFVQPNAEAMLPEDITNRPEYKQLTTQMELFDWRRKLINKANLPKISLFGNGYYGRPGFNFFNNDFRYYGMAGVNLSWNIGGSYTTIHQKRQLKVEKDIVENQRKIFQLQVQNQLQQQIQEIAKLQSLILQDDSITAIRSEVKQVAAVQYENGTITTTDYILKLNAESQAIINRDMHKIQLAMAHVEYKTLLAK